MAEKKAQVLCVMNLKEVQQWMLGKQRRGCWGWGWGAEGPRKLPTQLQSDGSIEECRWSVCQFFQPYLVRPKWLLQNEYLDRGGRRKDNPRVTCREADVRLWVLAQAF